MLEITALSLLLAGVVGLSACKRTRPLGDPQRWESERCLATLIVEHDDSPLSELRELGGWRDDFQVRFPAAVIDPSAQKPVSATASLTLEGQPIAWYSVPLDAVVLDGAAFAPLSQVNPTRMSADERQVVGRVTEAARLALGARTVVELLFRLGAIRTYWHLGADLCLVDEQAPPNGDYRARWTAVHHYVTNEDNEARYGFVVTIDGEGEIAVTGAAAATAGDP